MAMFNKILNILVFILAICAVVFGFFLFQKREELRKRGDTMARMINRVSTILDRNSGTEIAQALVPSKLELDPEKSAKASANAKISLYHDNYKNLATVLRPFEQQADSIINQRDILGTTLNNVMVTLQVPQPDNFAPSVFQSVDTYEAKKTDLLAIVKKVNDRDNATVQQIVDSASVIGFTMDPEALKNLDDYATPLGEFGTKVSALKTRSDTYASHIQDVCRILEVSQPSLEGEDYSDALSTAKTAVQGVKDDFEQCKKDLQITKEKLAETQDKLNEQIEICDKLEKEVKSLKDKIKKLLGEDEDGPGGPVDENYLVNKLEGSVIKVNTKWDFVVIDLGKQAKKNKMMRGVPGRQKEVNVSLPEGRVMDVARNSKFLGQIKIIRVNENCAIGDILPENKQGDIEPGDRVFFARTPKADDEEGKGEDGAGAGAGAGDDEGGFDDFE